jgi:hypothetical protein
MSGTTPRLGLKTFDTSDPFLRTDFNDTWGKLDASPGDLLCTSTTRPAWGTAQAGMRIYESDTRRELVWTGTGWREVLSAPAAWPGFVRPEVAMGKDTHVYYKMATFNVTRPGALLIILEAEVRCQSLYTANMSLRPQVDGADCQIGSTSSFMRVPQIHTSGGGWSRTWMMGALGLRTVGVGSHNFGVHFWTTPDSTTSTVSVQFTSARAVALMVNSTDT